MQHLSKMHENQKVKVRNVRKKIHDSAAVLRSRTLAKMQKLHLKDDDSNIIKLVLSFCKYSKNVFDPLLHLYKGLLALLLKEPNEKLEEFLDTLPELYSETLHFEIRSIKLKKSQSFNLTERSRFILLQDSFFINETRNYLNRFIALTLEISHQNLNESLKEIYSE